ncbi:MAG: outer membrane protein transport protein, partial [Bacteroidales bacterium]|nr:outer membrane protein transport protein [Bacteroidales bacterium]
TMDLNTISGAVTLATPTLDATIAQYTATSTLLNDKEADIEQTATGITPIVGINISPAENLNIGIKYEFATELEFTNLVNDNKDILLAFTATGTPVYMFNDGSTFRGDMPAMLSVGVDYGISEKLGVSVGTHYYFDKTADYGRKIDGLYVTNEEVIDNNFIEVAAGVQYALNEKLVVSTGFLMAKTGVTEDYSTDLSYSLTSNTIGLGAGYQLNDMMMLNLGFGNTFYTEGSKTMKRILPDDITETYNKSNLFVAVGLDFSF